MSLGVEGCCFDQAGVEISNAKEVISDLAVQGLANKEQRREVIKAIVKDGLTNIGLPLCLYNFWVRATDPKSWFENLDA